MTEKQISAPSEVEGLKSKMQNRSGKITLKKILAPVFLTVLVLTLVPSTALAFIVDIRTVEFQSQMSIAPEATNISKDGNLSFSVQVTSNANLTAGASDHTGRGGEGTPIAGIVAFATKDFSFCGQEDIADNTVFLSCENQRVDSTTGVVQIGQGETKTFNFTLTPADRALLGGNNSSAAGALNKLQLGVHLKYDTIFGNEYIAYKSSPSLEVTYKVFDTAPQNQPAVAQGTTTGSLKTQASGGAAIVKATDISFTVTTDASIYRAVKGKPITIKTQVSSNPELRVGQEIELVGVLNQRVNGFFVASVGFGKRENCIPDTDLCRYTSYEAQTSRASLIPFGADLVLDTSQAEYPLGANNTVGVRQISVIPILELVDVGGGTPDYAYSGGAPTITLEIYLDQASLNEAAAAACQANPNQVGCNPNGTVNNGSLGGTATTATVGTNATGGRTFWDTLGGLLLSIVNIILGIILGILRWIIWVIGAVIAVPLLESTLEMQVGEAAGSTILTGWTFVRDVVNMFFILFLIIIGFGTILKFENYSYKKLLVNLIVMAMLVNFSLVIGRIVLQVMDAAQFNFLPAGDMPGQPAGTTGVNYLFKNLSTVHLFSVGDGFRSFGFDADKATAATFTLLFQFLLELGVIITFTAMAIFMLIRTVALWILLILAPAAYALFVLPATKGLAKQWWSTFLKYALFGPILAFFLRLTLELYRNGLRIIPGQGGAWTDRDIITQLNDLARSGNFTFAQALDLILVYVLVLAFLWAGMIAARSMGIFGASAIVGMAERGMKFGVGAALFPARAGLGLAGQKWNEWTSKLLSPKAGVGRKLAFALLNPVGTYRGFMLRREERRGAAKEIAAGAGHEVAASFWTRGKEKIPYKELAMRRIEREQVRKLREAMGEDIDKAEARDFYKRVADVGGLEGDLLRGAYLKLVVAQGYGDDFTEVSGSRAYADKLKIPQDQRGIYNDRTFQTHAWATVGLDMEVLKKLREVQGYQDSGEYKSWLEKEGTQKKLRNLAELTNPAKDIGHYEQMYTAVRDETLEAKGIKAAFRPVIDEEFAGGLKERTDMILGETVKIPIRDFMRNVTWHNLIPKVFKNGKWDTGDVVDERGKLLLTPYQLGMIKKIGPEYVDQATHMQGRTVKYTAGQWVAEDGTITNPVQFDALRKINTGFADVLRNISVYGRSRPTGEDFARVAGRGRDIHINEIIDRENLDERVKGTVTKAYEEVHAGNWSHQDAAAHIATANIPHATINRILGDISEALAKRQAGLIVPTAYTPRTVAAALTPQQIQQLSDAVQRGVQQGFAAGHKFADPASKAALKVAINTGIEPILRSVNVSPADIDSISDAMAEQANKKI